MFTIGGRERDTAKHPTMHRIVLPTPTELPGPNVNSGKAGKP